MSVIVNNRSENVLAVFLKACDLFTFTVNTVHNEKYFKKRTFASLGKPIADLAQAIMAEVHYADETDNETETFTLAQSIRNRLPGRHNGGEPCQRCNLPKGKYYYELWPF